MRRKTLWFPFIAILAASLAGCGPAATNSEPFYAIGGGNTVNISVFNGKYIYTILSAQPANKPESNDSNPANWNIYPMTLATAAATSPSRTISLSLNNDGRYSGPAYYEKQAERDLLTRRMENEALASRAQQLSRRAPPAPISVGTVWNNVNILNSIGMWTLINTTCRFISNYAYFFIDNRDIIAMESYLADYGTAFDQIYQVNHNHFGAENDTDGNGKLIIVFSQELVDGPLGYFYAIDKYPNTIYSYSNEGDIFYITTDIDYQGDIVKGTLAHEFQHMIYFDEHYDRGVLGTFSWLNEALSQAAEYYNNYLENHHGWVGDFLDAGWGGLSLTHWTSFNYGYGAVFIRYLIDRYGDTAIKKMCSTDKIGVAAVEAATGGNFNTIFNNFTRALVLSGTGDSDNPLYNFSTLDLQAVQPNGRGGLTTPHYFDAGDSIVHSRGGLYPYEICFLGWNGDFGTMKLSGDSVIGTVFGISQ